MDEEKVSLASIMGDVDTLPYGLRDGDLYIEETSSSKSDAALPKQDAFKWHSDFQIFTWYLHGHKMLLPNLCCIIACCIVVGQLSAGAKRVFW